MLTLPWSSASLPTSSTECDFCSRPHSLQAWGGEVTQRTGWASMPANIRPATHAPSHWKLLEAWAATQEGPAVERWSTQSSPYPLWWWPALTWRAGPPKQLPGPLGAVTLPVPLSSNVVPVGIEDKESWHGKPLPKNMADQIIQEISGQIQSKKKILATPPEEDAPSVDITNIRMPTPPNYKVGDKVPS